MGETYKSSGVDIHAGEDLVNRIKGKVKSAHSPAVLTNIGGFGGLFELDWKGYENPVLVSSVDGVGTKIMVAILYDKHHTVGQDLVNHCVNDILTCGAKPLFFMDYFACGKLEVPVAEKVIEGISIACKENNTSLIGGETAEMPGIYKIGDYDLAGSITGVVEKGRILDKKNVEPGDLLIGLPSNGLHTNGYSLARKVLLSQFKISQHVEELGQTIGEELLRVHRSYLNITLPLLDKNLVHAISHITGGGIQGNTSRVIPEDCALHIDTQSWEIPPIFQLIQEQGKVPEQDMREAFNMGIGLIYIVAKKNADAVMEYLKKQNEKAIMIGEIIKNKG